MFSFFSPFHPDTATVSPELLYMLLYRLDQLTEVLEAIRTREAAKPEIEPKARYHLADAAAYLDASASTLKRRAAANKLVILYDGKTPFVMGAEILRYAREGAKRKPKQKRQTRTGAAGSACIQTGS